MLGCPKTTRAGASATAKKALVWLVYVLAPSLRVPSVRVKLSGHSPLTEKTATAVWELSQPRTGQSTARATKKPRCWQRGKAEGASLGEDAKCGRRCSRSGGQRGTGSWAAVTSGNRSCRWRSGRRPEASLPCCLELRALHLPGRQRARRARWKTCRHLTLHPDSDGAAAGAGG